MKQKSRGNLTNNIEVKETANNGKGIFALKDFKKDELILPIEGEIIETEDPSSVPNEIQDHWFPFDINGIKKMYVLPKAPWKYLNHSCNPNAGIKNNRHIVALRPIKKGEEIAFDYAMNNIDDWKMGCNCGSRKCRKTVSNFDVLEEDTKKKYLDYVLDCIREEYLLGLSKLNITNNYARDKTHMEQVERWANFVKNNPRSVWIKHVGPFVDAEIIMANRFYARLAKTKGGAEKIRKLRELRKLAV